MKAIIPVAGAGTKLRPITYTQPKPLIPVAGKPIISFIIDQLREAGIDDFIFIIGYLGDKIKDFVDDQYPDLKKEFVYQPKRLGLGHAIWMARDIVRDTKEIIIHLGDTIVDAKLENFINSDTSCLGVKKVKDPREFGVVEFDDQNNVIRVIEKPNIPNSNLAMVGLYKINAVPSLFRILDKLINNDQKTHGEYQLTDAIMKLIEEGEIFCTAEVDNWYDCGKKDILLETNAMLLERNIIYNSISHDFQDTIIIPPVAIGENCKIINSVIGPHVTIGNESSLNYAIVKESIIGNFASLEKVVLQNSVIGNDSIINGAAQSLNIGDNTQIDFS